MCYQCVLCVVFVNIDMIINEMLPKNLSLSIVQTGRQTRVDFLRPI